MSWVEESDALQTCVLAQERFVLVGKIRDVHMYVYTCMCIRIYNVGVVVYVHIRVYLFYIVLTNKSNGRRCADVARYVARGVCH